MPHAAAKPQPYRVGDRIRQPVGSVRMRIESVPAPRADGSPGEVFVRETFRKYLGPPQYIPTPAEITLHEGVAGIIQEMSLTLVGVDRTAPDRPRFRLHALGNAAKKRLPQEFTGLSVGDTFLVHRDYRILRVHDIVPSDAKRKLVGWVELVPELGPLDDASPD